MDMMLLILTIYYFITADLGEVKTALTEGKEKCFQMSHLHIFTIVRNLKMCWC